ncbi:hypothetical protein SODALDRAFT_108375 [Sodiomyces alkalinus F11]|uniref:Uncharacterized protein n=1 Tax=Sodiomyces alkalinus (strain CBS 110278 / VKM F-3762 / F11) TaxID=1314773 RepID=A0A3N2Q2F5_SODAK|nr:hypothetical protein SODALDRAFT_108375 [Sodiomyces alkalinus F11]ROT40944.1 hypothetical protein SODALDRAFT_108375 [Sodiomyces alkalinus F11]
MGKERLMGRLPGSAFVCWCHRGRFLIPPYKTHGCNVSTRRELQFKSRQIQYRRQHRAELAPTNKPKVKYCVQRKEKERKKNDGVAIATGAAGLDGTCSRFSGGLSRGRVRLALVRNIRFSVQAQLLGTRGRGVSVGRYGEARESGSSTSPRRDRDKPRSRLPRRAATLSPKRELPTHTHPLRSRHHKLPGRVRHQGLSRPARHSIILYPG